MVDRIEPESYEVGFPDLEVLRFRFRTIQFASLPWRDGQVGRPTELGMGMRRVNCRLPGPGVILPWCSAAGPTRYPIIPRQWKPGRT